MAVESPVDKAMLDRLVRDHLPAALRFATKLTGDPDQAEEIVQEALVRVVKNWRSLRDTARFRAWLWKIVVNVFRDHVRSTRNVSLLPDSLPDNRAVDPFWQATTNELHQAVMENIARLPDRQREVMLLIAIEDFSPDEVANILGMNTANVYATLHIARKKLRVALAHHLLAS